MMISEQLSLVLHAIYKKYNPDKVTSIPQLIQKYKGNERELLDSVFAKYNISREEQRIYLNPETYRTIEKDGVTEAEVATQSKNTNRRSKNLLIIGISFFVVVVIIVLFVIAVKYDIFNN